MDSRKLSWVEIEKAVCKSRMDQYQMPNFVPSHFTFYKNLLIFLAVPPAGQSYSNENTLIYVDISEAWEHMQVKQNCANEKSFSTFQCNLLLDPQACLNYFSYSKEEALLRERKRMVSHGITSYEFNTETGRLLFRNGSDIYSVDVNPVANGTAKFTTPHSIPTNLFGSKMDTKICPSNTNIISFIDHGDIWIVNIVTGSEMRLTYVRSMARDEPVSAGVPGYVIQEEFDRFTGYWWEPHKHQDMEGSLEVHRLLYELVDERCVEEMHITSQQDGSFTNLVETYRYPKAGSSNAKSTLRIIEFCVKSSTNEFLDGSIMEHELRVDLQELFPWVEYIVRCGWMPSSKHVWVQVLNRAQDHMALLRVPCSAFRPMNSRSNTESTLRKHKIDVLLEEKSDYWINVSDVLYFLPTTRSDKISFIWISEQTHFKHLYKYTVTTSSGDGYFGSAVNLDSSECVMRQCSVMSKKVLTSGSWDVDGERIWLDEKNELLYFMATKDTPLEKHLYCVSLASPVLITRLTPLGSSHTATLNKDCSHAVITSSSVSAFTHVNLCKITQNPTLARFSLDSIGWVYAPRELPFNYNQPELFQYTNLKGYEIYGMLFKPIDYVPGKKYPTMLYVYGGPGVQLVSNSQRSVRRLSLYALSSLGYAVVMIDTMGSCNRGIKFEAEIQSSMGTVEIEQQIEGLNHIAQTSGLIDMDKIIIHGWSYGGYLALMGLAQRPDIFKVAIAGAPVTCWELYDTGYTERYMRSPSDNKDAYRKASVLNFTKQFPNEPNRLLIVHGLIDENVHFSHTNALVTDLVKEGKPYQLQVYPCERHGIRHSAAAKHYETQVLWFIQQYFDSVT